MQSSLVHAEIDDQMVAAKEEIRETMAQARDESSMSLPSGVSRHDFEKWKQQKADALRRKCVELEDRLQRLQLLKAKISKMKENGEDTIQMSNATLSAKNATHGRTQAIETETYIPREVAWNLPGQTQEMTIEDFDDDMASPLGNVARYMATPGRRRRMPLYAPPQEEHDMARVAPFTPGMSGLRKIIHDEVTTSISGFVSQFMKENKKVGEDPNVETVSSRPRTSVHGAASRPRTSAWASRTGESECPPKLETLDADGPEIVLLPRKLEDAEVLSCPLLFGGFSRRSPFRTMCFKIWTSELWNGLFFLATLLACIWSGAAVEIPQLEPASNCRLLHSPVACVVNGVEWAFTVVYAFEIMVAIVALGFVNGPKTYLRISASHRMDFVLLVICIVDRITSELGIELVSVRGFRILRILQIVSRFQLLSMIRTIMATLLLNAGQMFTVLFVLIFFLLSMSTLLLTFLSGSSSRRCVKVEQNFGVCAADFATGWATPPPCDFKNWRRTFSAELFKDKPDAEFPVVVDDYYPFERWCKVALNKTAGQFDKDKDYDLDFKGRYHTCGRGRLNYKKGSEIALLNLAQSTTMDGYSDIIWITFQSEPEAQGAFVVIWLLFTVIASWLIMGIFVAVVTGTFASVHRRQKLEESANAAEDDREEIEQFQKLDFIDQQLYIRKRVQLATAEREQAFVKRLEAEHENKFGKNKFVQRISKVSIQDEKEKIQDFQQPDSSRLGTSKSTVFDIDIEQIISGYMKILIFHPCYIAFRSLIIVGHCLAMAGDQFDAPKPWRDAAQWCHIIFNSIFALDVTFRLFAWGRFFLGMRINLFELGLVIAGVIGSAQYSNSFKIFRLLPVLRVYLLLRYLPTLHHILIMAIGSAKPLGNVVVFVFTIALAVVVMGRDVFDQSMGFSRSNFNSFSQSMITVFQVFTGDGWSGVMYDAMKAQEDSGKNPVVGVFMILTWFIFSGVVINNLLVAVIIQAFNITATIENVKKPGHLATLRKEFQLGWQTFSKTTQAVLRKDVKVDVHQGGRLYDPLQRHFAPSDKTRALKAVDAKGYAPAPHIAPMPDIRERTKLSRVMKLIAWAHPSFFEPYEPVKEEFEHERVLLCFSAEGMVRRLAIRIGESNFFEAIVLAAIIVSCFFLVIMPPSGLSSKDILRIDPTYPILVSDQTVRWINYMFTFIFTLEFLVRIIDHGLLFTKRAYLKDGWNIMDSVIVFISWIDFIIDFLGLDQFKGGKVGKVLRLGRALRPLRVMKRNPSMRAVLGALLGTIRPVAYVIMFQMITCLIFALIGMGIFGGLFVNCSTGEEGDETVAFPRGIRECMGSYVRSDGVMVQRSWVNPDYHFDTLAQAMKTLFVVQNYPFVEFMYRSMDLTQYGMSHSLNYSMQNAIFFIAYVFVGAIFATNLFVGFIVDGFNLNKGSTNEDIWYNRFVRSLKMREPKLKDLHLPTNVVSVACRKLLESSVWRNFSLLCVCSNVAFNLSDNAYAPQWHINMLRIQNDVFNGVLFFEVFLTFCGYGPRGFLLDAFKGLDLIICIGAITAMASQNETISRFAKAFRLARILRLMVMIRAMRVILETAVACLPELTNIILLLVLVYSIFAVMFIQFFGMVKNGERLGQTAQFYTFGWSLFTMFQIVTGEAWDVMLSDCSVEWPKCTLAFNEQNVPGWTAWKGPEPLPMTDCGDQTSAFIFFAMLKVVCQQIMLNLFIGMILENFSFITDEVTLVPDESWTHGPSNDQIEINSKVFQLFCERRKKLTVRLSDVRAFLCVLPLPLGFRRSDGKLIMGLWEKAAIRIIRGELNVILMAKYQESQSHWWVRWNPFAQKYLRSSIAEVGYIPLLTTCLFWRKPDMVPAAIKDTRRARVEATVRVSYALLIYDNIRNFAATRVAKQERKKLQAVIRYMKWEATDEAKIRQKQEHFNDTASAKELAVKVKKKVADLYWPAKDTIRLVLEYVLELPDDMIAHHDMVMATAKTKNQHKALVFLRPDQGLEAFRQISKTHLLVMKDQDPNPKNNGYFIGDFTSLTYTGWAVNNTKKDTFFWPVARRLSADIQKNGFVKAPWTAIRSFMIKGKGLIERSRELPLGSIIDIQSYVHSEGKTKEEFMQGMKSRVRINIGQLRIDRIAEARSAGARPEFKEGEEQSQTKFKKENEFQKAPDKEVKNSAAANDHQTLPPRALEVLGYVPASSAAAIVSKNLLGSSGVGAYSENGNGTDNATDTENDGDPTGGEAVVPKKKSFFSRFGKSKIDESLPPAQFVGPDTNSSKVDLKARQEQDEEVELKPYSSSDEDEGASKRESNAAGSDDENENDIRYGATLRH